MTMGTQRLWNPYDPTRPRSWGMEENYAYNAMDMLMKTMKPPLQSTAMSIHRPRVKIEYHEEQGEFTEGTESPEYEKHCYRR